MLKKIAEGVLVHESECIKSNTVIIQGNTGVLLIDAGLTDDEMVTIADDLRELGQSVVAGFSTHSHWDHVLWHARFGEVPRYGTARCATDIQAFMSIATWKDDVVEGIPPEIVGQVPLNLLGLITGLPAGTTQIPWDGPKIRIIEHNAHAPGHAALLIEERRVLVAGDMLSDVLIPMLDLSVANPIKDYLTGLQLIEGVAGDVDVVVPGHGSVGEGEQVRARIELDRAYVQALSEGSTPDDPRISSSVEEGWDWVAGIHEWQLQQITKAKM